MANNLLISILHKLHFNPEDAGNEFFILAEFPSAEPGVRQAILSNLRLKI